MPRRTKVILIALVVLLGAGAALVFRKSPRSDDEESHAARPAGVREEAITVLEKPAPVSHLTGRIETPAGGSDSIANDRPFGGGRLSPPSGGMSPVNGASPLRTGSSFSSGATLIEQVRHKIVDGDTLSGLAQRYLGRSDRYHEIYEANRDLIPDPNLLPIGAVLRIPPANAPAAPSDPLEPRPMTPVTPRPDAAPAPPQPRASLTGASGSIIGNTYRVERNDTLSGIAKKVYGDARRYPQLLEANRRQLARPEDLREGMVLAIP